MEALAQWGWPHALALCAVLIVALRNPPTHELKGWRRTTRVYTIGSLLFLVCVGVNAVVLVPCWLIYLVSPRLKRKINSEVAQMLFIRGVSYLLPPVEVVLSGDEIKDGSQAIVVMNHQSDADWFFPWQLLTALGQGAYVKFILKDDFRKVPVIGWGLKGIDFIMLRRNWQQDKANLERQLQKFMSDNSSLRLMIFPEGTTINTKSTETSATFAKKEGRPEFKRLLLPRTTGFMACLSCLQQAPGGTVYDLTIAFEGYSGEVPTWDMGYSRNIDVLIPNMEKLMAGAPVGRAHVHVAAYSFKDAAAGGERWLDAVWTRKDALLEQFIKDGRFPGPSRVVKAPHDGMPFFAGAFVLPLGLAAAARAAVAAVVSAAGAAVARARQP